MHHGYLSLSRVVGLTLAVHVALFATGARAEAVEQRIHRSDIARPGELDQAFGENGRVTVPSRGFALPSADGKHWVVAKRESPAGRIEIRRLLEDGTRDPTFPLSGTIVDIYPGASDFELIAIRLQSSGKIIVGGRLFSADGASIPLFARLGTDGLLDPSFGENGIKLIDFDDKTSTRYFYGIDIQPDDKIVASTLSAIDGKIFPRLVRLNADGRQDAEFGRDGIVYDDHQGMIFLSTAVLRDGKLLFGGLSEPDNHAVLMRLDTNGSLDRSFGESGFVFLDHPEYPGMRVTSIALSHRDDAVVVGGVSATPTVSGWLARTLADGNLDRSFNNGAALFIDDLSIYTLATQDDEKIVLHGASRTSTSSSMAVGRVNQEGSLDSTFGLDGIAVTPSPAEPAFSNAYSYSEIQGKRLFVSDTLQFDDTYQIQLLRYTLF
ncbi:hypothetical protein [Luteibacter sp.]|jgi:uncharacterized delta-60 repeat protein|uniref:hypothetical protein n=1 Tax=Luteibacter sp. TaxID=1886636 RepID=UPI002F4108DA